MVLRASLAAFWVLTLGLSCVYLRLAEVRVGNRMHQHLQEIERVDDRVRRLEIRYNRLISPAALENELEGFFRSGVKEDPFEV